MSAIGPNRENALQALETRDVEALTLAHQGTNLHSSLLDQRSVNKFFETAGSHPNDLQIIEFLWDRFTEHSYTRISNYFSTSITLLENIFTRAKNNKDYPLKQWALKNEYIFDWRLNDILQKDGKRRCTSLLSLKTSPHFDAQKLFLSAIRNEEKGIALCSDLLDTFPDLLPDSFLKDTINSLQYESNAHLFLTLIIEKASSRLSPKTIETLFSISCRSKTHSATLVPLILEKVGTHLSSDMLSEAISTICRNTPLSDRIELIELLWETAIDRCQQEHQQYISLLPISLETLDQNILRSISSMLSNFSGGQINNASKEETIALLNYFLIKTIPRSNIFECGPVLMLLPNTSSQHKWMHAYLSKNGFLARQSTFQGKPQYTYAFRNFLHTLSPGGIDLYEQVIQNHASALSPLMLRWIFVKAAVEGEKGRPLMEWLMTRHADRLSPITHTRAAELAERAHDTKTAKWIRKRLEKTSFPQPTAASSSQASPAVDPVDIALLLKTSHDPYETSYQPLGDAPLLYGWKPLEQAELDSLKPAGYTPVLEDPFGGSDVTIVKDDHNSPLALNEIKESEAAYFRELYMLIRDGHTCLKITDKDQAEFKEFALSQFRKLLSRPSGRWTLLFACRMTTDLSIIKDDKHCYWCSSTMPQLGLKTEAEQLTRFRTKNTSNEVNTIEAIIPADSPIQHELLHAIHHDAHADLSRQLRITMPSEPGFNNLEEQYTIAGIDTRDPSFHSLGFLPLSDNTYRCEQGYPGRYDHEVF